MPRTLDDLQQTAKKNGWRLNPDLKIVTAVLNGLNRAEQKYGEGKYYCPCNIIKNPCNICPCESANKQILSKGICHCQLYVK